MPVKGLRADARKNRARILNKAREALARNPTASLNSIAKEAGIAIGTLYRHFPSRESLLLGVYRKEIDSLVARAAELLANNPPYFAFCKWTIEFSDSCVENYGAAEFILAGTLSPDVQEAYEQMVNLIDRFIYACQISGEVNPKISPEDFLVHLGLIWRIPLNHADRWRVRKLVHAILLSLDPNATIPS